MVIPAHDEAETIGACIASIRRSLADAACVAASITVVADRCRDRTVAAARTALDAHGTVISATVGNVGAARGLGTGRVLEDLRRRRSGLRHERTWLLATDADTLVPIEWVRAHLRLAEAGAAGVAGTVHVDTFADHHPSVADTFGRTYALHADGSHPHVHGANMGVRADAYLGVGGWPELDTAEDHALWSRLCDAGWPVISSIETRVTTSGRLIGRAPDGFAGHLRSLAPWVPDVVLVAQSEVPVHTSSGPGAQAPSPGGSTAHHQVPGPEPAAAGVLS